MIELTRDRLRFFFPDVHPEAKMSITFQRTLRIPDDGKDYPLPPGLGAFPLRHVDDFAAGVPSLWVKHGGVMLPMYQSEAMWLYFTGSFSRERGTRYPFAVKVAAGKINGVTGEAWSDGLHRDPQDYVVVPGQPWLDGFCVEKGVIRQFVAMPLGAGYSAEEQITGKAESGGVQIVVYPMKAEVFERRFPKRERMARARTEVVYGLAETCMAMPESADMGLAPGGRIRQEIYDDSFDLGDWDLRHGSRCFVHIANSLVWRAVTGEDPPTAPPTAKEYTRAGLPWFEYYSEGAKAVDGSKVLAGLRSVVEMGESKGDVPLPENATVDPANVVTLRRGLRPGQVREGRF